MLTHCALSFACAFRWWGLHQCNQTSTSALVQLVVDSFPEQNETFLLRLARPYGGEASGMLYSRIELPRIPATATILNGESECIGSWFHILYIYVVPLLPAYTVRIYVQYITTLGVYVQYCKYFTLCWLRMWVFILFCRRPATWGVLCPTRVQSEGG